MLTEQDYTTIATAAAIVIAIFLTIRAFYRQRIFKKVSAVSENYKTLQSLNKTYIFQTINRPRRKITHPTKSYKSFHKAEGRDAILYYIENNIDNLRSDISLAISNKLQYDAYLADLYNYSVKTDPAKIKAQHLSEKKFLKYEKILIERNILPIPYHIKLKIIIYYQSPKGRNYYEKHGTFGFDELASAYAIWQQQQSYAITAKYERSIMSDSIRYNVLNRDRYRCCICGASAQDGAKLHVDHIVPVSKGGRTVMDNLQTLCERCNLGKSNKL